MKNIFSIFAVACALLFTGVGAVPISSDEVEARETDYYRHHYRHRYHHWYPREDEINNEVAATENKEEGDLFPFGFGYHHRYGYYPRDTDVESSADEDAEAASSKLWPFGGYGYGPFRHRIFHRPGFFYRREDEDTDDAGAVPYHHRYRYRHRRPYYHHHRIY
uniref:Uncharacterized protein n=1 Tax=Psilocybe cubensis TaxID=181762 RepID=A0A8H7XL64_PSICU